MNVRRRGVVAGLGDLEDVAVAVGGARVGLVGPGLARQRRGWCCWSAPRRPCRSPGWARRPRGGPSWWRRPCRGQPGEDEHLRRRSCPGTSRLTPSARPAASHSPVPSNAPSEGSAPVPSISAAGLSPVNFATYRSPSASSVMLCARAPRAASRLHPLGRDELVDVVEALVVARCRRPRGRRAPTVMVAASCLNRPSAVCLTGVDVGSSRVDLDDPAEPVDLVRVPGWRASNRGSTVSQLAPGRARRRRDAVARALRCRRLGATKYWLKFSSPDSTVPHGVVPPEQLFRVPSTTRPMRVGRGAQQRRARRRARSARTGCCAVIRRLRRRAAHVAPRAARCAAAQLHDRAARARPWRSACARRARPAPRSAGT